MAGDESRPCTASSIYCRPSSSYSDQTTTTSDENLLNRCFDIPFERNAIDKLGLFMPESTTSNYLSHVMDDDDHNDDDGDVQIEIL